MSPNPKPSLRLRQVVSKPFHLLSGPVYVHALRFAWLVGFLYAEVWSFASAASLKSCRWRDKTEESANYFNILLIADPQMSDQHTNPHLPTVVSRALDWFSDQYIRRAYRALTRGNEAQKGGKDDIGAIIFMGDLTDMGRREQTTNEWEALHSRFDSLIQRDSRQSSSIPTFFLSGNHDVGLPLAPGQAAGFYSNPFSSPSFIERYGTPVHDFPPNVLKLYVPPNTTASDGLGPSKKKSINVRMPIFADGNQDKQSPTHEIILVDSQDLIGMQRIGGPYRSSEPHTPGAFNGKLRERAKAWFKETYDFVESLESAKGPALPRILITHEPLYRPQPSLPQDDFCDLPFRTSVHGVSRASKGTQKGLKQGTDRASTFQNLIGPEVSEWLLETIQPSLIFSADDHDHCELLHTLLYSVQYKFDREGKKRPKVEMQGFSEDSIKTTTPELTLKAFSISNPSVPGFARLSLYSKPSSPTYIQGQKMSAGRLSGISYRPCLLPDQIRLWSTIYPLLALITLAVLIWKSKIRKSGPDARGRNNDGYEMLAGTEVEKEEERRKRFEGEGDEAGPSTISSTPRRPSLGERSRNIAIDFFSVVIVAVPLWILVQWL